MPEHLAAAATTPSSDDETTCCGCCPNLPCLLSRRRRRTRRQVQSTSTFYVPVERGRSTLPGKGVGLVGAPSPQIQHGKRVDGDATGQTQPGRNALVQPSALEPTLLLPSLGKARLYPGHDSSSPGDAIPRTAPGLDSARVSERSSHSAPGQDEAQMHEEDPTMSDSIATVPQTRPLHPGPAPASAPGEGQPSGIFLTQERPIEVGIDGSKPSTTTQGLASKVILPATGTKHGPKPTSGGVSAATNKTKIFTLISLLLLVLPAMLLFLHFLAPDLPVREQCLYSESNSRSNNSAPYQVAPLPLPQAVKGEREVFELPPVIESAESHRNVEAVLEEAVGQEDGVSQSPKLTEVATVLDVETSGSTELHETCNEGVDMANDELATVSHVRQPYESDHKVEEDEVPLLEEAVRQEGEMSQSTKLTEVAAELRVETRATMELQDTSTGVVLEISQLATVSEVNTCDTSTLGSKENETSENEGMAQPTMSQETTTAAEEGEDKLQSSSSEENCPELHTEACPSKTFVPDDLSEQAQPTLEPSTLSRSKQLPRCPTVRRIFSAPYTAKEAKNHDCNLQTLEETRSVPTLAEDTGKPSLYLFSVEESHSLTEYDADPENPLVSQPRNRNRRAEPTTNEAQEVPVETQPGTMRHRPRVRRKIFRRKQREGRPMAKTPTQKPKRRQEEYGSRQAIHDPDVEDPTTSNQEHTGPLVETHESAEALATVLGRIQAPPIPTVEESVADPGTRRRGYRRVHRKTKRKKTQTKVLDLVEDPEDDDPEEECTTTPRNE